jgi:hypothetical protein
MQEDIRYFKYASSVHKVDFIGAANHTHIKASKTFCGMELEFEHGVWDCRETLPCCIERPQPQL